ncbi:MAG: hypothetical protein NTY35_04915 [Planctomycetota bacterium]|nr:hypothetical protein [Planctomycetota bacterium]
MSAQLLTGFLVLIAVPQGPESQRSQLEEVMSNVQAQPLGSGTVADLALPEDLLRRLSDRILRSSFEDAFRIVVAVPAVQAPSAAPAQEPAAPTPFRSILNVLAAGAVAVLAFLGYFAWRARARRKG